MTESKNIHSDIIPKISSGFCGGIARTSGICGAVSGAIMALSLFFGRSSPKEQIDQCYAAVQKLKGIFESKFGSTNCKQLTGIDLGTEEGLLRFLSENKREQCRDFVEEATRLTILLIDELS